MKKPRSTPFRRKPFSVSSTQPKPSRSGSAGPHRVTVPEIQASKGTKVISAVTAYDFSMARLIDQSGIELILVGDSLGSVVQGHENTLEVTLDQMVYHCQCVSRAVKRALVVGDLPFLSYQISVADAIKSAGRLVKEGRVAAVKLEGGVAMAETIERLVSIDIPVMGHVGLTPQSYHRMGGHRIQGKKHDAKARPGITAKPGTWERIFEDAIAVEAAGAFALVVEGVPAELAAEITKKVSIPTIGIGAGKQCDGQILVLHDLLGLNLGFSPRFAKRYAEMGQSIIDALTAYRTEVHCGAFPQDEHTYHAIESKKLTLAKR